MNKIKITWRIIEKVIGLFLLFPPLLGVLFFIISVFSGEGKHCTLESLSPQWTAVISHHIAVHKFDGDNNSSAGATSAAPIYLGLMAISGAYLLKGKDN